MRIYLEYNTRQIDRRLDNKLVTAGCTIINGFNSMQTTKGKTSSRQLTIHRTIVTNNGTKTDLKFDPIPQHATPKTGYRFVKYDPDNELHKNLPLYVRVKATDYTGQYDDVYDVYVKDRKVLTINCQANMNNFINKLDNILDKIM